MQYLKAFVAAAVAGLGVLAAAVDDNMVTAAEWINVAVAALGALGLVWAVPNMPKRIVPSNDKTERPYRPGM